MNVEDTGSYNSITCGAAPAGKIKVNGDHNLVNIAEFGGNIDIAIDGGGSSISIARMRRVGRLRIACKNGGSVSIGELSTAEDLYILADGANVSLGRDCMISFQVSIRTTDAHGIYDAMTGDLLNAPEDISIGDHVWLAQGAIIAKGTTIGANSVVGALSYLSKTSVGEGCIVAGTPARVLRDGIIWDRRMTSNIFEEGANVDPFLTNHLRRHNGDADALRRSKPILDI